VSWSGNGVPLILHTRVTSLTPIGWRIVFLMPAILGPGLSDLYSFRLEKLSFLKNVY